MIDVENGTAYRRYDPSKQLIFEGNDAIGQIRSSTSWKARDNS